MTTVTVSPKFQVVIPREIRDRLDLKPGQKVAMSLADGVIKMVPIVEIKALRGFTPGISTEVERDRDRV